MRAVISNQLASSGSEWAETFSMFHSGTYTNQWMILDLKRFTPSKLPVYGFLTVLEEVPGRVHWQDMTDILARDNYWASYNNPFFKDSKSLDYMQFSNNSHCSTRAVRIQRCMQLK
jgi:hypothetical protein